MLRFTANLIMQGRSMREEVSHPPTSENASVDLHF